MTGVQTCALPIFLYLRKFAYHTIQHPFKKKQVERRAGGAGGRGRGFEGGRVERGGGGEEEEMMQDVYRIE